MSQVIELYPEAAAVPEDIEAMQNIVAELQAMIEEGRVVSLGVCAVLKRDLAYWGCVAPENDPFRLSGMLARMQFEIHDMVTMEADDDA